MSRYRRIRYEDRCQIYALSKRGASQESIARILGVSQSAVSREKRRNRGAPLDKPTKRFEPVPSAPDRQRWPL